MKTCCLAKIMQIYNRYSMSVSKYNMILDQIREFVRYKELPDKLRKKLFRYVDFKFQKRIFKEAEIKNTLSSILKQVGNFSCSFITNFSLCVSLNPFLFSFFSL